MTDDQEVLPDIPDFLKRDANNRAEFMKMKTQEDKQEKTKAKAAEAIKASRAKEAKPAKKEAGNGRDTDKADGKVKAKAAGKATGAAKPAKGTKAAGKAAKPASKATKAAKGEKPTAKSPTKAKARESTVERDEFGFRKGSLKSSAAAMYSARKGATLAEVKAKLSSSQLNLLKELEAEGFTIRKEKEKGSGKKNVTRYFLSAK